MAYIGKQPKEVGNFQKCDAISVVMVMYIQFNSRQWQMGNSENANHMLVSLNGVLQDPLTRLQYQDLHLPSQAILQREMSSTSYLKMMY